MTHLACWCLTFNYLVLIGIDDLDFERAHRYPEMAVLTVLSRQCSIVVKVCLGERSGNFGSCQCVDDTGSSECTQIR